ncbi:hypothetical protein A2645_00755 [Candidatus Nomurabacteria bacterium RIFCSPHIGHO2_01_FULL_39_9]|uniref:HicB-like antitoxin of toxin-antitoxin system domain-containing protein n=1 Tax=Candidatus Nomurabacteria bacterium RIFCSPHIGHO2_01_FULL_39_9 TaxID=1801735 RepID=A0A1F6UVK9_9BACT|nr:MAG: hypothetical protein A2645_00755 [Candidatus Nomurabacteria bacterium RIFCSPHIGHO2_01_FULL_39_9]
MVKQLILTTKIWKEGRWFVAYSPEFEVASQGKTKEEAEKNLKIAINLFLETAKKKGTLLQILKESGFIKEKNDWLMPSIIIFPFEVKV